MRPFFSRLRLQDLEDQLLLAHSGGPHHAQVFSHLSQGADVHFLQLGDVEDFAFFSSVDLFFLDFFGFHFLFLCRHNFSL